MRTSAVVVVTAIIAFAAGFWTKDVIATAGIPTGQSSAEPANILPIELHRRVNPSDLPVHDVGNYN